jgi:hypothetical protein
MNIDVHLLTLSRHLADAAALGGDEMVELAERLALPLQAAARLVLQDALSEAMQEVTLDLAPGAAELRLRGREIDFVVTHPTGSPAMADRSDVTTVPSGAMDDAASEPPSEAGTARISFRPPDWLKAQIEEAAEREGLSVNAFLVRTLTAALRPSLQKPVQADPGTPEGRSGSRLEGWVY